jgi:hypothetical protein
MRIIWEEHVPEELVLIELFWVRLHAAKTVKDPVQLYTHARGGWQSKHSVTPCQSHHSSMNETLDSFSGAHHCLDGREMRF